MMVPMKLESSQLYVVINILLHLDLDTVTVYIMLKHTFTVTGEPQDGALVTMGPDWKHEDRGMPTGKDGKNKQAKIKRNLKKEGYLALKEEEMT